MTQNTSPVIVPKGRTCVLAVHVGYDISGRVFTSQIRAEKFPTAALIAEWTASLLTDGTDGELLLTLDDSDTSEINLPGGYMDLKMVVGGEPMNVWDEPIEVLFRETVTV